MIVFFTVSQQLTLTKTSAVRLILSWGVLTSLVLTKITLLLVALLGVNYHVHQCYES